MDGGGASTKSSATAATIELQARSAEAPAAKSRQDMRAPQSNLRRFANQRSLANLSLATKQIAPTTAIASTPTRTKMSSMGVLLRLGWRIASAVSTSASSRGLRSRRTLTGTTVYSIAPIAHQGTSVRGNPNDGPHLRIFDNHIPTKTGALARGDLPEGPQEWCAGRDGT
jgi:hypothetical protein